MKTASFKKTVLVAMLSCIAIPVFAENAPVYDIDNFPPQFDGQSSSEPSSEAKSLMQSATKDQSRAEQMYAPTQDINQRVARLEQQVNNAMHADTSEKMNDLQSQVQSLRGQVDELAHQLQQLQTQQKAMYSDLDKRVSRRAPVPEATNDVDAAAPDTASLDTSDTVKPAKLKSKPKLPTSQDADVADVTPKAAAIKSPVVKNNNQPNVAEEQQIYQTAYNLIKAKKYSEAASTLQSMLKKYPSGQFAANAHYWLGELYGLMSKNDQAANEFGLVVTNYPESPKIADAQLKLGLIYASQSKWPNAKAAFKKVINHYPGTSWARLASEQLKQLKQAGH